MPRYYVLYDIPKMNYTNQKAGPYTSDEVHAQAQDIEGFDGVTNVRVISEPLLQKLAEESAKIVDSIGFTD